MYRSFTGIKILFLIFDLKWAGESNLSYSFFIVFSLNFFFYLDNYPRIFLKHPTADRVQNISFAKPIQGKIVTLSPGGEHVSWKQLRFLEVEVYNGPLIGKRYILLFLVSWLYLM